MEDKNSRATISRRRMMKMAALAATSGASMFASQNSGGGSLLIRRGHLATANKRWDADIRIRDGKVVEIDRNLQRKDEERVIDALGLQVLPGGIDPHAHLLPPWVDDYESGSKEASNNNCRICEVAMLLWPHGHRHEVVAGEVQSSIGVFR
jgi:imidazolonepropionase-like amidohydrolase